jgi:AcrR family transcriptional regulator
MNQVQSQQPAPKEAKKEDRRIQRTRAALAEALMALIIEKGDYDSIQIQEITDKANVSRTTFYLHYRDKDELLFQAIEEMYDEMVTRLAPIDRDELIKQGFTPTLLHPDDYEHVAQHAAFYRVMLSKRGTMPLVVRVQAYLAQVYSEEFGGLTQGEKPRIPLAVIANYFAGAQIGLISWWLANDMPYTPQEMAQMGYCLAGFGMWQAMGLDVSLPDFDAILNHRT